MVLSPNVYEPPIDTLLVFHLLWRFMSCYSVFKSAIDCHGTIEINLYSSSFSYSPDKEMDV